MDPTQRGEKGEGKTWQELKEGRKECFVPSIFFFSPLLIRLVSMPSRKKNMLLYCNGSGSSNNKKSFSPSGMEGESIMLLPPPPPPPPQLWQKKSATPPHRTVHEAEGKQREKGEKFFFIHERFLFSGRKTRTKYWGGSSAYFTAGKRKKSCRISLDVRLKFPPHFFGGCRIVFFLILFPLFSPLYYR